MPVVRLFAQAREAAGTSRAEVDGSTVAEVLAEAQARFGSGFGEVLPICGIWVNGEPADAEAAVGADDEVAVLPPVSGGAVEVPRTSARSAGSAPGRTATGRRQGSSGTGATSRNGAAEASRAATGTKQGSTKQGGSKQGGTKQGSTKQGGTKQGGTRQAGARAAAAPVGRIERLLPRPDIGGPRVRVGVLWFFLALAAATAGRWATGILWAVVAAAAGTEVVRSWWSALRRPGDDTPATDLVAAAAVGAALVPVAAAVGTGLAGLVLVVVSAGSYAVAQVLRRNGEASTEVAIGAVLPAVVATAVVVTVRAELWSGLFLILAVSLYDAGNYLMGAESRSRFEGPLLGIVGVAAVTFTMAAFQPPPFETATAWVVGGLVAVACPLGQALTNALLPPTPGRVRALRRLDAYALAAPVMLAATWLLS